MKTSLTPYLNFEGQTGPAMKFYQSILGGELKMQTFEEYKIPTAPEDKDKIIHAELKNDTLTFMASDVIEEHKVQMGDNIHMSIMGSDEALLTKFFYALAEGGKINMPLA
jgi:PhnB protein